ncbi:MAG TPA: hypothetical protein PLD48_07010 [Bacillota bacterium]|nr:hypothetical protein [Bacillota bacterium]HOK69123.1 hypothetical protein [Bacillota bacterium]HPP85545.1 hypothetical protein [Bacillota bacterium]
MKYQIASLIVEMRPEGKTLLARSAPYLTASDRKADIQINIDRGRLVRMRKENPHLTDDDCEYIHTGEVFYKALLGFDGMLVHASAVALDREAYLFSAKSGGGKSTHAALWQKVFGERAHIVNDDKPALRRIDGKFMVFGTPWSGKTDLNTNESAPLKAIAFLEQGTKNKITRLSAKEALLMLLNQTLRPAAEWNRLSSLLDRLIKEIPFYKLTCDISADAVRCAYDAMR